MSQQYIGELRILAFSFPPKGWAFCNGQLLPINQNQALFSLLGTTYGGNGTTTFALPNLQSRVPMHFGNGNAQGAVFGEESHTLLSNEMPLHSHAVNALTSAGTATSPIGNLFANAGSALYSDGGAPAQTLAAGTLTTTTGGQPHENRQPLLAINVCIALTGIFPSRN